MVPEVRRHRHPAQEVRPALPAAIEELGLEDERRAIAHGLGGLRGGGVQGLTRVGTGLARHVDVATTLGVQAIQLLALVSLAPVADEIGVRVVDGSRLGPLAAHDREPLLRQMRAREMVGQVGGREDQRSVVETKHRLLSRAEGCGV